MVRRAVIYGLLALLLAIADVSWSSDVRFEVAPTGVITAYTSTGKQVVHPPGAVVAATVVWVSKPDTLDGRDPTAIVAIDEVFAGSIPDTVTVECQLVPRDFDGNERLVVVATGIDYPPLMVPGYKVLAALRKSAWSIAYNDEDPSKVGWQFADSYWTEMHERHAIRRVVRRSVPVDEEAYFRALETGSPVDVPAAWEQLREWMGFCGTGFGRIRPHYEALAELLASFERRNELWQLKERWLESRDD